MRTTAGRRELFAANEDAGRPVADYRLLGMMLGEPPLVINRWPRLAAELTTALREADETDLVDQVDTLRVLRGCGCGDDFCQSFYTQPPPVSAYGPGHRNVGLSPSQPGMLVLDVVDDVIMFVEVVDRPLLD